MAANPNCLYHCLNPECGHKVLLPRSAIERSFIPRCDRCGEILEPSKRAKAIMTSLRDSHRPSESVSEDELDQWKKQIIEAANLLKVEKAIAELDARGLWPISPESSSPTE